MVPTANIMPNKSQPPKPSHKRRILAGRLWLLVSLLLVESVFCEPQNSRASNTINFLFEKQIELHQHQQQILQHRIGISLNHTDSMRRFLVDTEGCHVVEECRNCDTMARAEIAECAATGRIERWKCGAVAGEETEEETAGITAGAGTVYLNRSCLRTKAEDEFLMVRLQVICVLIGTAAFVSARRQKVVSASLFDQRKLGLDAKRRRRDSSGNATTNEIELSSMEETVPLTEDAVDII